MVFSYKRHTLHAFFFFVLYSVKFPPVFFFNLAFALAHYVNAMLWSKKRRKKKNAAMLNQLMLVLTLVLLCGFEGKRWRVGLTELFTCLFLFFFVFAMCTCGLVDGTLKARCCRWFWCLQLKTELFIHVAATRTYTNAHTHIYTRKREIACCGSITCCQLFTLKKGTPRFVRCSVDFTFFFS